MEGHQDDTYTAEQETNKVDASEHAIIYSRQVGYQPEHPFVDSRTGEINEEPGEGTANTDAAEQEHQGRVSNGEYDGIGDVDIEEDVSTDSFCGEEENRRDIPDKTMPAPLATTDTISDEEISDVPENTPTNNANSDDEIEEDDQVEASSTPQHEPSEGLHDNDEDRTDDEGIEKDASNDESADLKVKGAREPVSILEWQPADMPRNGEEQDTLEQQIVRDVSDAVDGADSQDTFPNNGDEDHFTDKNITSDALHDLAADTASPATTEYQQHPPPLPERTSDTSAELTSEQCEAPLPKYQTTTELTPLDDASRESITEQQSSTQTRVPYNAVEKPLAADGKLAAPLDEYPDSVRYTSPLDWFQAVSAGSMKRLNRMLQSGGIDINIQDQLGRNALHVASAAGYSAMVEQLLSRMENVDVPTERYETALMLASRSGHTSIVRLLLARGADANATAEDGSTALSLSASRGQAETASVLLANGASVTYDVLHAAAACGSESTVQVLLDSGAVSVDDANSDGVTALHCAAVAGHVGVVMELTSRSADVNARGAGVCALHVAAEHGHSGVVKVLLDAGANANSKRLYRQRRDVTALHLAALKNHVAVVDLLLANKNCDVDVGDSDRATALHYATRIGNSGVVRSLVMAGCDVDASSSSAQTDGQTALHLAVRHGYADIVELLISAGCDVNLAEQVTLHDDVINITLDDAHVKTVSLDETTAPVYGYAAIHWAAEKANAHIIRMLLASGADVNALAAFEGNSGVTALHLAAQDGCTDVLQELLSREDCGRDPRKATKDRSRVTPLHQAAYNGHLEAALALLHAGSDPNAATDNGYTPLHYATQQGHPHMISALLASGAKQTPAASNTSPLYLAVRSGRAEAIRALVDAGCPVDSPSPCDSSTTPLHTAVQCGNLVAVRALLDLGADPDGNADTSNPAPLHIAAEQGNVAIVSELLERNATVDRQYTAGPHVDVTAIHVAAHAGHARVVLLLVTAGGDVNALRTYTDRYDVTPLHLAAENGHVDVTETLLEAKCKLDLQDGLGYTALHLALQYRHQAVADRLLAAGCSIKKQTLSGMTALKLAEQLHDGDMTDTLKREKRDRKQSKSRSLIAEPSSQKRRSGVMALLCGVNKEH